MFEEETLEEKCLLIHVSTHVHIKTRQTCNSFSLRPFQEDCLLFFALFYYPLLFLKFERGWDCNPRSPPPSRSTNDSFVGCRYMVVDCGGGTVDITVHQVDKGEKLIELYRATGGPYGSIGKSGVDR